MQSNPWDAKHSVRDGLSLIASTSKEFRARKRVKRVKLDSSDKVKDYSSVRFIHFLKESDRLNDEIYSLKRRQEWQKVHKDFHRILSTDVIEGFVSMVDFLYQHLCKIVENKNILVKHMQKTYLADHVPVDANFHEDICRFYPLIASNIAGLLSVLQNFEWMCKFSLERSSIEETLEAISRASIIVQEAQDSMKETRELLIDMASQIE